MDYRWQLVAMAFVGLAIGLVAWIFDLSGSVAGLAFGVALVIGTIAVARLASRRR